MRTSVLVLCAAALTSARQASDPIAGHWAGVTDAFGRPAVIEARFESAQEGVRGSYQRLGAAGSGYDAPVGARAPIAGVAIAGDTVRFTLRSGARELAFAGALRGEVLSGAIQTPNGPRALTLRRVRTFDERALVPYVGTYARGDTMLAATWREFGGLRLIDLGTGEARSLVPDSDTSFLDLASLIASTDTPARVVFARDRSGPMRSVRMVDPRSQESPHSAEPFVRDDRFTQERLRFAGDGVSLAGTLLLPARTGRHPAIVIVHGSGPIYASALFERAAHFARMGYATLVYDKRGTGGSTGAWQGASFEQLAADASGAVRALAGRADIDPRRIGLQGHSQAGYVIPIVAASSSDVAFAAIVSGGPLGTAEQSLYDKENDLRAAGFDEAETRSALALMRRMFAYVRDSVGDRAALEAEYLAAKRERWFPVTDLPDIPTIPPWAQAPPPMHGWRDELRFDGARYVAQMTIPTLVILGSEDRTVPPQRMAEVWRAAWAGGGHPANRLEMVAGADHGLRLPASGGRRAIAPRYFEIHRAWLASLGGEGARHAR